MGTLTYIATGLPASCSPLTTIAKAISVGDSGTITGINIIVDATAPDEGLGIDPTLVKLYLIHTYANGTSTDIVLHDGEYKSLNFAEYEETVESTESVNVFESRESFGVWTLYLFNISAVANATLNYYELQITFDDTSAVGNTSVFIKPSTKFGDGVSFNRTHRSIFDLESNNSVSRANGKYNVFFNGTWNTTVINTMPNGTLTGSPTLDIYRVRNSEKTLVKSTPITTAPTISSRVFVEIPDEYKPVREGDFITVEIGGTNVVAPGMIVQMEFFE